MVEERYFASPYFTFNCFCSQGPVFFPGFYTSCTVQYLVYNIWQDVGIRTRIAATAARCATNIYISVSSLCEKCKPSSYADCRGVNICLYIYMISQTGGGERRFMAKFVRYSSTSVVGPKTSGSGSRILAQFRSGSRVTGILPILKEKIRNHFREK